MISNYNLSCDYHNFELKDKIYLIPQWALKVIYTDGFNEVVFSGNSANVTILEGYDISFQEETSFDERFKFSKTLSIKVDGYKTFNDLDYRYMAIIETKEGEFYLVNVDFPSYVTHTYTLNNGTNSTELVFSSQSNIATLKLTNFNPNNVNSCKQYSNAKIKNVKLTEAWASYLSTWQKSLVNKGEFVDIEPLPDSVSLTEEFDGEKYTVTLGFDIPMSYYKNDWHIKLLQFEENKYRGYIELEDGNVAFVGYNVGLFPSYVINGDIISIKLQEIAIRGIAYGNDYVLIDTDIPNTIEYNGASCYTYNWLSTCDWHVEDKPEYITISPTSGEANTQYELEICNTDDETGYAVSEFIIKSCHANARAEVIIENPIFRWINTQETICAEITNERWVESGTTCAGTHGVDKYVNSVKLVSYDDGETWYNTGIQSATTLIEENSPDCGYSARTVSTGTTCSGTHSVDKYQLIEYQESYDYGSTWVTISSTTGSLIEVNSYDCGYRERWVESGTTCLGSDKFTKDNKFISYNSGSTWLDSGEYSAKTLIEVDSEDCFTHQYFTVVAREDNLTFKTNKRISYSIDSGLTWTTISQDGSVPVLSAGDKIMFKNANLYIGYEAGTLFYNWTGDVDIEGNIMSLWNGDNFVEATETGYPGQLGYLFSPSPVVNAKNLVLPKHVANYSYYHMFEWCEKLVSAPKLPATELGAYSYESMFDGCTSLREIICLATKINVTNSTKNWVRYLPSTGTFYKNSSMSSWSTGNSGIPSGWTVVDYTG